MGTLGKLQGDGVCLDPFPPPRVSLVRPGRVHSPVLGPWRVTDHSKPTPNQKGVEACSPRPATPHYDLLKTGYRGLQGHQMPLSCPFTQTPLMERREDSPSSRNSHRLPGREDLDVPECAHRVSASTHAHACPLCVCAPLGTPASLAVSGWTRHAFTKRGDGRHHLAAAPAWMPASRGSFAQPRGVGPPGNAKARPLP